MEISRCFFVIVLSFTICFSGHSQPDHLKRQPTFVDPGLSPTVAKPRWFAAITEKSSPLLQKKKPVSERIMSTRKFPRGYTHDQWDPAKEKFVPIDSKSVVNTGTVDLRIYSTQLNDTMRISDVTLDTNFKNEDILDYLLPGVINETYLRPVRGLWPNSVLKIEEKIKSGSGFATTRSYSGREMLPFGYRYKEAFYYYVTCDQAGSSFMIESKSRQEDTLWIADGHVTQQNCATNEVMQEWKYTYKFDMRGNFVEDIEYIKQNGDYVLNYNVTHEYDDKNRETRYTSVLENKKYEFIYDEYDNAIASQFKWNGAAWVQTNQTVKTVDVTDVTTITYTNQQIVNGTWTDRWRSTYQFDGQKRLLYNSTEFINATTHEWYLDNSLRLSFDKDNLVKEEAIYSGNSAGSRTLYTYDSNDKLVQAETFFCDGNDNCAQDMYEPVFKANYALPASDTLDYLRSWQFDQGAYQALDSIANVYDDNGDLKELYYEYFPLNQRDRYKFVYDAVTSVVENEPAIAIYPNPAKNSLFIQTPWKDFAVNIYDFKGSLMASYSTPQGPVDVSSLPEGLYFVQINSGAKRHSAKIAVR